MDAVLDKSGQVLRIEKTSIHDGEGLRTVVFLKGCPLHCKWCSTPESQARCVTAGYGKDMTVEQVVKEISKDEVFFFHSGGGVTISGGEVLMQADFAAAILKETLERGISTAIETSLFAEFSEIKKMIPYLSSIYVDFKIYDEDTHRFYTGVSNEKIKENLKKLDQIYHGPIHIRIPTIPGINMNSDNMLKTAEFLSHLTHIKSVELLPYHRLGLETYQRLNKVYELKEVTPPTMGEMKPMAEVFRQQLPQIIVKIKGEIVT